MDPKGHAAIVTGGASGLGAETAAHLVGAGAKIVAPGRRIGGRAAPPALLERPAALRPGGETQPFVQE
ncbi:MAG: 3-hydroxyacyl-CoA dehydrogenase, partial [Peptococcaceae bacterium]|nr:3-hydroxyacyl-CoA dehydrogenase [Peptococcaceae bacterium]